MMLRYDENIQAKFNCFCEAVCNEKKISEREYQLIILVQALLSNSSLAVKDAVISAKAWGITNEEISYISGILVMQQGKMLTQIQEGEVEKKSQQTCCS